MKLAFFLNENFSFLLVMKRVDYKALDLAQVKYNYVCWSRSPLSFVA